MRSLLLLLPLTLILASCGEQEEQALPLPNAIGKPGTIDVVIDKALYDGNTGEYLRKVFEENYPGINRPEPYFTLRWVAPVNIGTAAQYRNLIIVVPNENEEDSTDYEMFRNRDAIGQFTVQINYSDLEGLRDLLMDKAYDFRDMFHKEEILRYQQKHADNPNITLQKRIKEKFGVTMDIPKNAYMVKDTAGFAWMDLDYKQDVKGEGIYSITEMFMVWDEPYTSKEQLTAEGALAARDSVLKKRVLSRQWTDNDHMETYMGDIIPLKLEHRKHNDKHYAWVFRGLWQLKYGYEGGPFVHLVFHDEKNGRVVNVCGSLRAQRVDQRNHVREMEAVVFSSRLE